MNQKVWGVHAGYKCDAIKLFLENGVIALKRPEMGDLSDLQTPDEFLKHYQETYKAYHRGSQINAGQVYILARQMKVGDFVITFSKPQNNYILGKILGEYEYSPATSQTYLHLRRVEWLKHISKNEFSTQMKNSMGSGVPIFSLEKNREEIEKIFGL